MELDRLKDIKIHGMAKFFHWVFMTLTYPLRHPFRFIIFLLAIALALLAVPLAQHVPLKNTLSWYFSQNQNISVVSPHKKGLPQPKVLHPSQRNTHVSTAEILPLSELSASEPKQYQPMKVPSKWLEKKDEKEQESPMEEDQQALLAHEEEALPEASHEVSLPPEEPAKILQEPVQTAEIAQEPEPLTEEVQELKDKPAYRKDEDLPLVYEDQPQRIKGKVMIFSPNEITVGKTYLILYGIYTNPQKYDVKAAEKYLTKLVRGKTVECDLVAYTYQNLPTGVCYVNGQSLNQKLVDAGFADNVAL